MPSKNEPFALTSIIQSPAAHRIALSQSPKLWGGRVLSLIAGAFILASGVMRAQAAEPTNRPTLYYIPHTHWEGAVFKTREEYLEMGLPNILKAVKLLK